METQFFTFCVTVLLLVLTEAGLRLIQVQAVYLKRDPKKHQWRVRQRREFDQ